MSLIDRDIKNEELKKEYNDRLNTPQVLKIQSSTDYVLKFMARREKLTVDELFEIVKK